MRQSLGIILIFFMFSVFMTSYSWAGSTNKKEEDEMQQEIKRLQKLYVGDFKDKEAVFEGIKVYRENAIVNKKNKSILFTIRAFVRQALRP